MKKLLLTVWLALPVAGFAYHMGPGQDRLRLDDAQQRIAEAREHVAAAEEVTAAGNELAAKSEWARAEVAYAEALGMLGDAQVFEQRAVRLERAKCQMQVSKLPEANAALTELVDELQTDATSDPLQVADARHALANSEYYMTWLMRLEGLGREEWEPRIEAARQTFKLLAVEAAEAGDDERRTASEKDLEASIRLARIDLSELQGLPLPSQ